MKLVLFCKGQPLKRPRLSSNNGVYQPKDNQQEILEALWVYTPILDGSPIDGPIIVDMTFVFSRNAHKFAPHGAKRADYPTDKKFGDEDNLRKAINDGLVTTKIITDDRFIIGGSTYKVFGEDDEILIKIYRIKQ